MKRRVSQLIAASLAFAGASVVLAQSPEPTNLIRIIREDIKPGRGGAHEKTEMAYVRAFSKSKYPNYLALASVSGPSQVWFLERYDSWAAMGEAFQIAETEPLKSTLDQLDVQDGEQRTGERNLIATYQKDLSYLPTPSNLLKVRFITVNTVRIRPGHGEDFAEMRKLLNAAFTKSDNKQRRVVYQVSSGAPAGTYLILSGMESLKAMDPAPGAMGMAAAFGADSLARYQKLQSEVIISAESALFAVNPKMSYPAKEFITADPNFWTPKPKQAAAAPAKTAAP